jgi:hypothetical protein
VSIRYYWPDAAPTDFVMENSQMQKKTRKRRREFSETQYVRCRKPLVTKECDRPLKLARRQRRKAFLKAVIKTEMILRKK